MLSKSLAHYPQFRFKNGSKRLWNPILKKTFAIRPEEQVRLALVDYLTLEAGFSSSRISFESPVKLVGDKSSSRTDIICYDADFKPLLLVECKAPAITLDEKAAIQIARYNQKVGAPFLLVSNGTTDFWFKIEDQDVQSLPEIPEPFQPKNKLQRAFDYWKNRAFIGKDVPPAARPYAVESCNTLFSDPHQPVTYLKFESQPPEFALAHYYRIFGLKENLKVALSISANSYNGTRLNAILNKEEQNIAFCSISLHLLAEKEKVNGEIHSAKGVFEIDAAEQLTLNFIQDIAELAVPMSNLLVEHS